MISSLGSSLGSPPGSSSGSPLGCPHGPGGRFARLRAIALALGFAAMVALPSAARAEGDVGVIVTGEGSIQPQLAAQIADWLTRHGHTLVPSPLPPDAITALIDCVVIADRTCARTIVERSAKSSRMVFAQIDTRASAGSGARDVTLTAYWFDKGHDALAERQTCERCNAASLRTTAEEILRKLVGSGTGHLKLKSNPSGARIVIDGEAIGVTPLDTDLPRGKHTIAMDKRGFVTASRDIVVASDQTAAVSLELLPPSLEDRAVISRTVPIAMVIGGAGAAIAGGVLIGLDQDPDPALPPRIRATAPLGIGLAVGGAVLAGVGGCLLLFRSPEARSTPVAAIAGDGAYIGWSGRF